MGDPVGISWRCLMLIKTEWLGYRMVKKNYDDMLSRFHLIPERYGQTDGRTDLLYQYRASVCRRAINTHWWTLMIIIIHIRLEYANLSNLWTIHERQENDSRTVARHLANLNKLPCILLGLDWAVKIAEIGNFSYKFALLLLLLLL